MALVASSCSKKAGPLENLPGASPADTRATTTRGTVTSVLTGDEITPIVAARPVVIVKVDNSPGARPQAGLNSADLIYEERVEGSVVRFLAVFQSKDATVVGPVRSVRSTDAAIIAPLGGVFAFSGGIKPFVDKATATGVKTVLETDDPSSGVSKRAGKVRPYATYANTVKLRPQAKSTNTPPQLFPRLAEGSLFADAHPTSTVVDSIRVVFGSLTTADWSWDASKHLWLRSTNGTIHVLEDKSRVSADCLVLQTVPYRATPYTDRSGARVDEAVITGTGNAEIACEGRVVAARWSKPSMKAITTYADATTGAPMQLPAGRVWVSFVPTNGVITHKVPVRTTTTLKR
ncbi:MAG: hypothetical protein QOF21_157 [Actinomycetota bacterium]|jgi:hypothetical protein